MIPTIEVPSVDAAILKKLARFWKKIYLCRKFPQGIRKNNNLKFLKKTFDNN